MSTEQRQQGVTQPGGADARPAVSAVIPAYNAADTIERALNSVCAQTYENIIEVIVVDDGSKDNTAEIVREKFPDVRLIEQENQGNAGARNTGVAAATGEYIAFLDADDEWLEHKLRTQVGVLRRHPGIRLLTCAVELASGTGERDGDSVRCSVAEAPIVREIPFLDWLRRGECKLDTTTCCSGWVLDRDLFDECNGLDASLARSVDWEFLVRVTALGYSVATVWKPLYRYYVSRTSVSNSPRGMLENAAITPKIVALYDPQLGGWRGQLLTANEYLDALAGIHFRAAWSLWGPRCLSEARGHLRLAEKYARRGGKTALRYRLARLAPSVYLFLARHK